VRSTFYLTTSLAQHYERLSRRLAQSGEIATHGDTHRVLGGLSPRDQRTRLQTTQRDLLEIVGHGANGLRPPEEQFDLATMSEWIAAKGNYMFGANDSRSASPELLRIGGDTLVLVGRVGSDDFAATARRARGLDAVTATFMGEFERVRALGGHYVLSYHSQVLARPDLVPALASFARRLVADTAVWVTAVGDVATWWRDRAQLDARARLTGDALRIIVRNRGADSVRDAVVRVSLPEARRAVRADARLLPSSARTARLLVPVLPPRTTKVYSMTLAATR
jgi:peptidoglycan/xylan/chitin deacetylase (PgdA/CDA1 family)